MRLCLLADRDVADVLDFTLFLVKGSSQMHDLRWNGCLYVVHRRFAHLELEEGYVFDVSRVVLVIDLVSFKNLRSGLSSVLATCLSDNSQRLEVIQTLNVVRERNIVFFLSAVENGDDRVVEASIQLNQTLNQDRSKNKHVCNVSVG